MWFTITIVIFNPLLIVESIDVGCTSGYRIQQGRLIYLPTSLFCGGDHRYMVEEAYRGAIGQIFADIAGFLCQDDIMRKVET